jgi:serine/threonine-protein kinase
MVELAPGAVIGGKYRLMRPLGSGSMGSIWAAWQAGIERAVAIKVMSPELLASPLARTRFEREMAATGRLRTPHVVQLYDHGLEGDAPYLVMELLEGEDLGERLKRTGRLPLDEAARIGAQIAAALRSAHEAGIVHRDLKPANVFLAKQDGAEIVKVIDFGIARFMNQGDGPGGASTRTGNAVGSPHYMSPEQAQGLKTVDHRSDLWSFGVILFRAVTGQLPFPGKDILAVIQRLWSEEAPAPSTVAADLGPSVDRFFARALARDPNARFQSADELSLAFAELGRDAASPASSGATFAVAATQSALAPLAPAPAPPSSLPAPTAPPRAAKTNTAFMVVLLIGVVTVAVAISVVLTLTMDPGGDPASETDGAAAPADKKARAAQSSPAASARESDEDDIDWKKIAASAEKDLKRRKPPPPKSPAPPRR